MVMVILMVGSNDGGQEESAGESGDESEPTDSGNSTCNNGRE